MLWMLPAIVLILFFTGAVNAANMVLSQTNEKKRSIAVLLALGLGVLPSWQVAEIWSSPFGLGTSIQAPSSPRIPLDVPPPKYLPYSD